MTDQEVLEQLALEAGMDGDRVKAATRPAWSRSSFELFVPKPKAAAAPGPKPKRKRRAKPSLIVGTARVGTFPEIIRRTRLGSWLVLVTHGCGHQVEYDSLMRTEMFAQREAHKRSLSACQQCNDKSHG